MHIRKCGFYKITNCDFKRVGEVANCDITKSNFYKEQERGNRKPPYAFIEQCRKKICAINVFEKASLKYPVIDKLLKNNIVKL